MNKSIQRMTVMVVAGLALAGMTTFSQASWQAAQITGVMNSSACTLYLYTSNTLNRVSIDDMAMVSGSTAETGANLIGNPGFENGTNGWEFVGGSAASVVSSSQKRSGASALTLQATTASGSGGSANSVKQTVSGMTSGQVYTLSFWYEATQAVDFVVRFSATPAMSTLIAVGAAGTVSNAYVWQQGKVTGVMNASSYKFYLYTSNTLDCVYIDDMAMVQGSVAETGANLIGNPGFESNTNGWEFVGNSAASVVTAVQKRSGSSALQLHASPASASGGSANSVKQTVSGMTSGDVYTLSFWYCASNAVDFVVRYSAVTNMSLLLQIPTGGTVGPAKPGDPTDGELVAKAQYGSNFMRMAWTAHAGKAYRIMKRDSLVGGGWQQHSIVTAAVTDVTVDLPLSGLSGFFRLLEMAQTPPVVDNATGASAIGATSATLNGTLTSTGVAPTTVYACWDTSDKGTASLAAWAHADLIGVRPTGAFTDILTGLSSNTTYYYRCYAANMAGSMFASSASSFTTVTFTIPTLTSPTVNSPGSASATLGATITSAGSSPITARGTCWGTSPAPTGNALAEGGTGVGAFTQARTGLSAGTFYYYRGYAVSAAGTGYSPDGTFWTEPASASGLAFSSVTSNSMTVSWSTNATLAAGCVVIYRDGADLTSDPVDGTTYSVGGTIGGGTVAVVGGGTSVNLTGLTPGHTYYVRVYDYTGSGTAINYQQDNPASGSQATSSGVVVTLPPSAFYQIQAKYWDGYGANYASTYVFVSDPVAGNHAPVISAVTASPSTISAMGTVNLSVSATDSDGDPLKYFWVAPAGQLGWSRAATETWRAASVGATYQLQVMVGDGKTWTSGYVTVQVTGNGLDDGNGNHIASITAVTAAKTTVSPGETINISFSKYDRDPHPNGDSESSITVSGGAVGGSGSSGTWTAPSASAGTSTNRPTKPGYVMWSRLPADQASSPIPPSTDLVGIGLVGRVSRQQFSDTWMPCWASDGSMYSAWQDGALSTPPFENLSDWPTAATNPNHDNGWAHIRGDDPMDLLVTGAGILTSAQSGWCSRLPGAVVYKDGVVYYGTRLVQSYDINGNRTYDDATRYRPALGPFAGFHTSTDGGNSWSMSPHGPNNFLFGSGDPVNGQNGRVRFGQMYMVDYGKNQNHSPDGKLYFVSNGSLDSDPTLDAMNDDSVYLCRVSPSQANLNNGSAYEFYAGNGNWSTDIAAAQPIVTWDDHISGATVVYNPGLNKYLMTCYRQHYTVNGAQTLWATDDTYIMESDSLTGPYKMVQYFTSFGPQAYYPNIPSKFISGDGKSAWMWYGANFYPSFSIPEDPVGAGYRMTEQEIRFLTPSDVANSP